MAQKMLAYVLNQELETLDILDGFESFIWTERFSEYGDFQVSLMPNSHVLESMIYPNYLLLQGSDILMCIDDYELNQSWKNGDTVTVTGRSLETILETRRIFYPLSFENEPIKTCLETILNQNVISPAMTERKYSYIQLGEFSPRCSTEKYTGEFFGETVYEAMETLCKSGDIGMKMVPDFTTKKFILSFYDGVERTWESQIEAPVVFSPGYENLISAKYYKSNLTFANAAVIHGADLEVKIKNGDEEVTTQVPMYAFAVSENEEDKRDRDRVEIVVEATGISSKIDDENSYTEAQYKQLLINAGKAQIGRHKVTETFSGDIEPLRQFIYGRDFFLGDIVDVLDSYGHEGRSRISEIVESEDDTGHLITPTFVVVKKEGSE